jgi:hypothetical protein
MLDGLPAMNADAPPATVLRKRRIRSRWTAVGMASTLSHHPLLAGVAGTVAAVLMASLSLVTLYQGRQGACSTTPTKHRRIWSQF